MFAKIGFDDLKVMCVIGDLPHERERQQSLLIDLRVTWDISGCRGSDRLEQTCDYVALQNLCQLVAKEGEFQMIETLALAIIDAIREKYAGPAVFIRIKKPDALTGAKWAVVEVEG